LLLKPGEQHVLLVPHVLPQHRGQSIEERLSLGVDRTRLQAGDQLVDLLMLLLDLQRQGLPV
jgi:hypothetical protein